MQQQVHFVTIGSADVERAHRFYVDGLGWPVVLAIPGEITFVQAGHGLVLSLWSAEALAADAEIPYERATGSPNLTVAHNVDSEDEVTAFVELARAAGARVLKEPQHAGFGGFHAYLTDPDGVMWEVAHNPGWLVESDGSVRLTAPSTDDDHDGDHDGA